jgi:UDP-GlcNAc:undecaprenyl-phosphate/decaprenyl-phosphate GlcNAc-1-phosphate transferase
VFIETYKILIICFSSSIILSVLSSKIAQKFNIFDYPDSSRKFHDKKTALTGGIIIFFSISIFFLLHLINYANQNVQSIQDINQYMTLILGCSIFFLLGLIDDIKNLSPNKKIFFFIITLILLIFIDDDMNIRNISLSVLDYNFSIGAFSYFWTVICFLLFINALNMFDGINLQVTMFSFISVLYLISFHSLLNDFLMVVGFSLLCFSILNYSSKSFLGNSGSYLLGFLIGFMFVKTYNLENNIYADQIVLLMIIPGLDLIRLFFSRIFKKRHPFSPDRGHLHHYLLNKFSNTNTFLIISLIIWVPFFIAKFTGLIFLLLIYQFIFYFSLIIYLSKKKY